MNEETEVLIVGGGPGGSTAAALLAAAGRRVVVAEKEKFPRFHVGESLLPYNRMIFERLGVWDAIKARGFQRKWGARFVFEPTMESVHLDFERGLDQSVAESFHARRADLDALLLDNARDKGAEVREETRCEEVLFEGGRAVGARLRCKDGGRYPMTARLVVDATGRDALLGGQIGLRQRDDQLRQAAMFAHWEGVEMGLGKEGGDILIVGGPFGWSWLIPLDERTASVGLVFPGELMKQRQGRTLEQLYDDLVAQSPTLSERLRHARRLVAVNPAADFSYRCSAFSGPGWAMVGDSAAFLDPIFSSGILLAMGSAEKFVELALPRLRKGQDLTPRDHDAYRRFVLRGLDRFRRFILAFYDPAGSTLLRADPPNLLYRSAMSIFAGKVFTRDPRIWLFEKAFEKAAAIKRREAAKGKLALALPPASDFGRPQPEARQG